MSGMSASSAKREPRRKVKTTADVVYTINDVKYTFAEVRDLVRKADPTSVVSDKKLRARLERGHRDVKALAADRLPNYTPESYR